MRDVCIPLRRRVSVMLWLCYTYSCVRLLRCPFDSDGQYQSLYAWDGQQSTGSHAFSFQCYADDVSPKAYCRTMGNKTQISVSSEVDGKNMVAGKDKTDPILRMIERYSLKGLDGWEAEVSCLNSIKSCVYGCNEEEVNGVIKQHRHPHQVCIATSTLDSFTYSLMNSDILYKMEHIDQ